MENIIEKIQYLKENKTLDIRHKSCDSIVLKEKVKEYPYYCSKCDKYLYEYETLHSYRNITIDESLDILEQILRK